jgi:two-component system chemotaxis response regulator CheY
LKTLIVDDVLLLRHVLEKTLSKYGECDIAENGEEALEMFTVHFKRNNSYDLICLDLMMPGVNGLEVLKQVRALEDSKNLPPEGKCKIIIITSVSDQSFVSKAIALGCDDYLVKPLTPKMLIRKLIKLNLVPRGK